MAIYEMSTPPAVTFVAVGLGHSDHAGLGQISQNVLHSIFTTLRTIEDLLCALRRATLYELLKDTRRATELPNNMYFRLDYEVTEDASVFRAQY